MVTHDIASWTTICDYMQGNTSALRRCRSPAGRMGPLSCLGAAARWSWDLPECKI